MKYDKLLKELYEPKQKLQVGDVCILCYCDTEIRIGQCNKIKVQEKIIKNTCIIAGSYAQKFWGDNYGKYEVFDLTTGYCSAWFCDPQLKYVRKANYKEIEKFINKKAVCHSVYGIEDKIVCKIREFLDLENQV
ncbi:MAG: hypothetical protein M0R51_08635 [Clostridia bacterium]|jgi:hypothetical protein|nr:hypothetical protein [Clostridia bacterium]